MTEIKEQMLVKVSAQENNNKFYHVVLNGSTITTRYGRVGSDGVSSTSSGTEYSFQRIVESKVKRGYKPTAILGQTAASASNDDLLAVARKNLTAVHDDPIVDALISRLVSINRHEIMENSGGLIKVSLDGVISTPLGLLGLPTIIEASKVLKSLKRKNKDVNARIPLLENYLSLVPQKVPSQRGWQSNFLSDPLELQKQFEFLDQLKDSVSWFEAQQKGASSGDASEGIEAKFAKLFRYKILPLSDGSSEFKRIDKLYRSTQNYRHAASGLKLKKVYEIVDEEGLSAYESALKTLGHEKELWHGTRAFNLLSILRKGLFVPPATGTSIPVAGRMFGDGVYFSDQSTKSLNYSAGYWTNRYGTQDNNCFMLLSNVALGRQFKPSYFDANSLQKAHHGVDRHGIPFNSINVKGGTCGVMNNEIIVWDTDQIQIKYLCEFDS
jgi:poly [ADP-ribose] polymerase